MNPCQNSRFDLTIEFSCNALFVQFLFCLSSGECGKRLHCIEYRYTVYAAVRFVIDFKEVK